MQTGVADPQHIRIHHAVLDPGKDSVCVGRIQHVQHSDVCKPWPVVAEIDALLGLPLYCLEQHSGIRIIFSGTFCRSYLQTKVISACICLQKPS